MTTMHGYGNVLAAASALLGFFVATVREYRVPRRRPTSPVRSVLFLAVVLGCSPGPSTEPITGTRGDSGVGDAGAKPLVFSPCTLLTDPAYPPPPSGALASAGEYDGVPSALARLRAPGHAYTDFATQNAECATMHVPAIWSDPKGGTLDVFVKRYPAKKQPAKAQLWMLTGGPGFAGPLDETDAFLVATTIPDFDIYIPDFRGTGKSTYAKCTGDALQQLDCTDTAPPRAGLTLTDAAKDLAALIDASRASRQQVFVHGVSYGTIWAQRYLQLRPSQATAVILDSSVPAVGHDYANFDVQFDDTAHSVLELCKTDATCSAKLGPDPIATAQKAVAAVDAGTCALPGIRFFLGEGLLGNQSQYERTLFPAAIYRILRCNDADRAWFEKARSFVGWWGSLSHVGFNDFVKLNVDFLESWSTDITTTDIAARRTAQVATSLYSSELASWASRWPRGFRDGYFGKWPSSPVPILILQGTLDPRTPYGDIMRAQYSGKNQYYVEFPGANHAIFLPTATPMVEPAAPGCGWQVIRSFLEDPTRAPDTSCISGMMPVFGTPPKEWFDLVGIQDLWENP
jgi:pimeloyl-ACP methyl ester carboxylesterase